MGSAGHAGGRAGGMGAATTMVWAQNYDPFGAFWLSALVSAVPIATLLLAIALFRIRTPIAAAIGLGAAFLVAALVYRMPVSMALAAAVLGAANGLLPIGWLVLNILFLYRLTVMRGQFASLQTQIATITPDRRLQLLLIAFGFGAFFEGCAGFGAPVAITGAMLVGLGFSPIAASQLALLANTAPVAFGSGGTPIIALASASGLPLMDLSAMAGRQLPLFSFLLPFWLVTAFAGWRGMAQVWPALFVAGIAYAVPQFLVSNLHGPWLVDVVAALSSIGATALFLRYWRPRQIWMTEGVAAPAGDAVSATGQPAWRAWLPWLILSAGVFVWGLPPVRGFLDAWTLRLPMPGLDGLVLRGPPVVSAQQPEAAVYALAFLSTTGTGILVSAVLAGLAMGARPMEMLRCYAGTVRLAVPALATIAAMFAIGYLTRYSGADAVLGLALATSGVLYPFFGTLLGWLGVAATGSDTASNVLFGNLQRTSAEHLGISPVLMAAANSTGGVMGKMIDAQSIVVASTATGVRGREGEILRYLMFHSVALVTLVGLYVLAQAYWWPLSATVVR